MEQLGQVIRKTSDALFATNTLVLLINVKTQKLPRIHVSN